MTRVQMHTAGPVPGGKYLKHEAEDSSLQYRKCERKNNFHTSLGKDG
jgi:hypothetical protein